MRLGIAILLTAAMSAEAGGVSGRVTPVSRARTQVHSPAELRAAMLTLGYAHLPASAVLADGEADHIRSAIEASKPWARLPESDATLFQQEDAAGLWQSQDRDRSLKSPALHKLVAGVTAALRAALPDESIVLDRNSARLQLTRGSQISGNFLHADAYYVTATYAPHEPGTVVYDADGPDGVEIPAPAGAVSIISNAFREAVTGRPATIHSAPRLGEADKRSVVLLRYHGAGAKTAAMGKEYQHVFDAVRRRTERIEAALKGLPPPAP